MSTVLSQLQSILDAEQLALLAQVMFEQLGRAATLRARRRFSEAECVQCLSARRRQTAVVSRHACHTVQSGAACAALSVPRPGATGSKAQASLSRCVHSALRSRAFAGGDWRVPQQDRPRVSGRFRGRRRLGRLGGGRHGRPRRQRGRGPGRQLGRGTPCDLAAKGRELLRTPHTWQCSATFAFAHAFQASGACCVLAWQVSCSALHPLRCGPCCMDAWLCAWPCMVQEEAERGAWPSRRRDSWLESEDSGSTSDSEAEELDANLDALLASTPWVRVCVGLLRRCV